MSETLELQLAGEAGEILGVCAARVRQLADAGKLKAAFRTSKGTRLFLRSEVEKLRAEREKAAAE